MILTKFIFVLLLTTLSTNALDKDSEESNNISVSPAPSAVKLDATLRKALLRAIAELENSATSKEQEEEDNSVHRAQSSSFTIYAKTTNENSKTSKSNEDNNNFESDDTTENIPQQNLKEEEEEEIATTTSPEMQEIELESTTKETNEPPFVIFQRSSSISEPISIQSIEKDPIIDPLKDAEQILTSASNNFNRDINIKGENNKIASNKDVIEGKNGRSLKLASQNAIVDQDAKQKLHKNQNYSTTSTTTLAPSSTTSESEAKVEQVQFFSAPLVAAFTVHQDEQGQPKKVEPIFRNGASKQKQEILKNQQQILNQPTFQNHQLPSSQTDLLQKQKLLEEQLLRLKQQHTQQELFFQQQLLQQQEQQSRNNNSQQLLKLQQQQNQQEFIFQQQLLQQQQQQDQHQSRNNNNQQNFAKLVNKAKNPTGRLEPVFNEPDKNLLNQAFNTNLDQNTVRVLNKFTSNDVINNNTPAGLGNISVKQSQSSSVKVEPSITFDPLLAEAGKLPLNAQFLPVKEATNFRAPFVNSLNFQPLPVAQKNSFFQPNLARNPQINFQIPSQQNFGLNQQLTSFQTNQNQINNHNLQNLGLNQHFPSFQTNQNQINHNFAQPQVNNAFNQANFLPSFNNQNTFSQNQIPFQTNTFNNNLLNNNNFKPSQFNIGELPLQNNPTRFNRQEIGTGNFLNNNNNAFSIQQSTQPFLPTHQFSFVRSNLNPLVENNRFFRSNQESTNLNPQNTRFLNPLQTSNANAQNTRVFRSNLEGSVPNLNQVQKQNINAQNNRFFRSNQESTFTNNINQVPRFAPPQVNRQLNSLLYNQGFGGRDTEDLNVVTKVLSLNYNQNNRHLRNVPPFK